jgi:hypothetical protein
MTQQRSILYSSAAGTRGSHTGTAIFESIGSALGSIRSRLHDLTRTGASGATAAAADGGDPSVAMAASAAAAAPAEAHGASSPPPRPSELLTSITERLATAERAHSTRMPLSVGGTIAGAASAAATESATGMVANDSFDSPPRTLPAPAQFSSLRQTSVSSLGDTSSSTESKRCRTSVLVASRRNAEIHERHDAEVHEGTAVAAAAAASLLTGGDVSPPQTMRNDEGDPPAPGDEIELVLPESESGQEHLDVVDASGATPLAKGDAGGGSAQHYAYHHRTGSLQVVSPPASPSRTTVKPPTSKGRDLTPEPTTTPQYPPVYIWGSLTFGEQESDDDGDGYGNGTDGKGEEGGCQREGDHILLGLLPRKLWRPTNIDIESTGDNSKMGVPLARTKRHQAIPTTR